MNENFNKNIDEEKLYEEQIKNEFNENFPEHKNSGLGMYFVYAFIFVAVLIAFGVSSTYAYYTMSSTTSSSTTAIHVTADCIDVSIDNSTTQKLNLTYNYPITDDFATSGSNITPYILKIKNSCQNNIADVKYTLALSSIKSSTESKTYISDDQIRMKVMKQIGTGSENVLKPNQYFNALTKISTGNRINEILTGDLSSNLTGYTVTNSYELDKDAIAKNTTISYKIYLWIDYYEGDANMYKEANAIPHDTSKDGSTKGKEFSVVASLVVN